MRIRTVPALAVALVVSALCVWPVQIGAQAGLNYNDYFVRSNVNNGIGSVNGTYSYNWDLTNPALIGGGVHPGSTAGFTATGTMDGTGRGRALNIVARADCAGPVPVCVGQSGFNRTATTADLATATLTARSAGTNDGPQRYGIGRGDAWLHDVLQFTVAGATAQTVTRVHFQYAVNGTWTNATTPNAGLVQADLCMNNFASQACDLESVSGLILLGRTLGSGFAVPRPSGLRAGPNGSWTTATGNALVYNGYFDIVGPSQTIRPTLILVVQGESSSDSDVAYTGRFSFTNLPPQVRYTSASGVFLPLPPNTGPPSAPTNVVATASGNNLSLSWGAPATGATPTGYTLIARTAAGAPPIAAVPLGPTTSFAAAVPNGTFILSLSATNAAGTGPESPGTTVTLPAPLIAPASPTGLGVTVAGSTATFSWTAPLSGGAPTGYLLLAATSPGFTVPIASLPLPASPTSAAIPGVPAGIYYVRLAAQNAGGTSAPSNEVTVIVVGVVTPGAPTLSASVSGRTVNVSWTPGSGGTPTGYTLSAATSDGGAPIGSVPVSGASVAFPNVPSGTYFLRLTASNSAGTSPPSNQVAVTVP